MQLNKYHAYFIDQLRAAAAKDGSVAQLLELLGRAVYIEFADEFPGANSGQITLAGDEDDLHWLRAAQFAAMFVNADNQDGADSPAKEE